MLQKGYRYKHWQTTLAKLTEINSHSYLLGRIEDVRNHEFQTVMLTPEVVSQVWQAKPENIAAVSSAIYVAVTRATQCLILPEQLRNWIEEISTR